MSRWTARVAASGMLVVAIDMTLAPEAPYPASVQDANYGVRWLKHRRRTNGTATLRNLGVLGSSSGGHIAELLGMRPRDARYNAIPLPERRSSTQRWPTSQRARRSATRTRATSRRRK